MPWPPSAELTCPKVRVTCNIERCGTGSAACANPGNCEIFISPKMCQLLEFPEGEYPVAIFKKKVGCSDAEPRQVAAYGLREFGLICCSIRHEYAHLVDPNKADRLRKTFSCGEIYAENFENYCLDRVVETYCSPERISKDPKLKAACAGLCQWKSRQSLQEVWDGCICSESSTSQEAPTQANCDKCEQKCRQGGGSQYRDGFIPRCKGFLSGWNSEFLRETLCHQLAQSSAHSCSYYKSLPLPEARSADTNPVSGVVPAP